MTKEVYGKIYYEDSMVNSCYHQATFWFKAPVDILNGGFPEAHSAEIMIEVPIYSMDAQHAQVSFSPVAEDGERYFWYSAELSEDEIKGLIALAKLKETRWQV